MRMHLDAAGERIGRIEDDFVGNRKAGSYFYGIAEVMADGDWHELDAVTTDDTDAEALGAKQQCVRGNRNRVLDRGQVEMSEHIGAGTQHALPVVDIYLDIKSARGVVDGVGIA